MTRFVLRSLAVSFVSIALFACGSTDSSDSKYTLSEVVPDPVPVLTSAVLGTVQLDLAEQPLSESESDAFLQLIADGTIGLTVASDTTAVSYNLTEGTRVEGTPSAAGEYALLQDGSMVEIVFWNSFMGSAIQTGGDYTAAVTVQANSHFSTEDFTASVLVE